MIFWNEVNFVFLLYKCIMILFYKSFLINLNVLYYNFFFKWRYYYYICSKLGLGLNWNKIRDSGLEEDI